jgi:hypothetical protein
MVTSRIVLLENDILTHTSAKSQVLCLRPTNEPLHIVLTANFTLECMKAASWNVFQA